MKAMILAAGIGSRLQPITNTKPKALVELNGVTMLERTINKLKDAGIDEFVINVHHFPEMIIDFLKKNKNFGVKINISDETKQLLDTGGAILKAAKFLKGDDPFLVQNVDIITDIDYELMMGAHYSSGAIATVAVKDRDTGRKLLFDDDNLLQGWINNNTGETKLISGSIKTLTPLAFSGIQFIEPDFFNFLSLKGKFSIIDAYLEVAQMLPVSSYRHDNDAWIDLGKIELITSMGLDIK